MTWVAGADGCKTGWVVILRDVRSGRMEVRLASRIGEVLRWQATPEILCVDIPIGLLDHAVAGGRECDKAARALLGRPRGSSVFSPPARRTLKAKTFKEALRLNRKTSPNGPGIAIQAYSILPKIREVDELVTPSLQRRVVEVHPELCFYEMNRHRPVVEPKKRAAGRERRMQLLQKVWARELSELIDFRPRGVARDDVIDAMAACWTGERLLRKEETRLPVEPPRDSRGLRMEIVR